MSDSIYIITYILFILTIHSLSSLKIAYKGNYIGLFAMSIIILFSLSKLSGNFLIFSILSIILGATFGIFIAYKIKMQNLPQMVAILNSLGGLSSGLIGIAEITSFHLNSPLILLIIILGFTTFSGSIASFVRLNNSFNIKDISTIKIITFMFFITMIITSFYAYNSNTKYILGLSLITIIWGFLFILPIGGADMPIIISILNSLSGWTTVLVGFSINNYLLIITGTLVGSSGIILTYVMTKAMNRNLIHIIFNYIHSIPNNNTTNSFKNIHLGTPKDVAFLMENANKIIIIPGFGMASSNAQHELVNLSKILKEKYNVDVKFAIHPVAGRMPGHMNILLAEADVDTNIVFELKDINQEFKTTDIAYVIGANDITNPLAKTLPDSPIYKMPILEVEDAKKIIFVKRSLSPGYAGLDNPLFYKENTIMLQGDAKEITMQIIAELEQN
ncbi:MAG: NAD(P)(+) transhydrogenase (Re/Si-specific) subunit beta [Alphaproteobacteria bacterium]|nr:NAD(P)(+) transhydrogenase (Re/Si-specific) subunit beta [Alphaproteobacteria bacterium]